MCVMEYFSGYNPSEEKGGLTPQEWHQLQLITIYFNCNIIVQDEDGKYQMTFKIQSSGSTADRLHLSRQYHYLQSEDANFSIFYERDAHLLLKIAKFRRLFCR